MAGININLEELQQLIAFFNNQGQQLESIQASIKTKLEEMKMGWVSTGKRGHEFYQSSDDYNAGFQQLLTAHNEMIDFLNNSLQAYTVADS
jgi:uncharacterized protein YukE